MGGEQSHPADRLYIGRSRFGGEGCCKKIQRTFGLQDEGMSSQLRRWADKEWEKSKKKASDLGSQSKEYEAKVKQDKEQKRAERAAKQKAKKEKHRDVMGEFKKALIAGMQVRQHLPKGKVRDVKLWIMPRGDKEGKRPENKKPAGVSASDWQNNWWYIRLGSEARSLCWPLGNLFSVSPLRLNPQKSAADKATVKRVNDFRALALLKFKGDEVRMELETEELRDVFVNCMSSLTDQLRSCFASFDASGMIQINVKFQQKLFNDNTEAEAEDDDSGSGSPNRSRDSPNRSPSKSRASGGDASDEFSDALSSPSKTRTPKKQV